MEGLKVIKQALDKATQKGAFTLDEMYHIINAYDSIQTHVSKIESMLKSLERDLEKIEGAKCMQKEPVNLDLKKAK